MRAVLSQAGWLLLAAAVPPAAGVRADPPREPPAAQADGNARGSGDGEAQQEGRAEAETPPAAVRGTRVLTLQEKVCRQRHACANPAAPCRPCDR